MGWQLKKGDLKQSKFMLSAVQNISGRIEELGCPCYLSGPKDISWFILGAPVIPVTDIWFSVDLSDGMTLDDLFQKLKVSQRICKILIEQAPPPESLGLHPALAYGLTKDGIPIYNPGHTLFSHFTQPRLRNAILADYGLPERTVDLRKAFLDGEERDQLDELVKAVCGVHAELKGVFANLGWFVIREETKAVVNPALPSLAQQQEDNPRDDIVFEATTMPMKVLSESGYHCVVSGMMASYLQANDAELLLPEVSSVKEISSRDAELFFLPLVNGNRCILSRRCQSHPESPIEAFSVLHRKDKSPRIRDEIAGPLL
ncbi:uncharacterized protein EV420DRAFT_1545617 [Desarmillaria tabescens]|uniref:Uncharacterized protein n=1 Tax=Armillaria tabescens TaxID=1929756 RepID=A0AA39KB97_ARMTA|nr:uncharacterized protein EV420DRAFT_1545617 [Desarmillaria tabescens]KAK0457964.1 hypothetical protein EV420DRAFT_1545617 [Desarmillaria tabescens]